jgi:hypothetical protein
VIVPDVELGQLPVTVFPFFFPDVDTQCPPPHSIQGAQSLNTIKIHASGPGFYFIATTHHNPVHVGARIQIVKIPVVNSIIN